MDTIGSAEFRKTYAKLDRPTMVTVNGHPIGVWNPTNEEPVSFGYLAIQEGGAHPARLSQADRDAILRRVNKG